MVVIGCGLCPGYVLIDPMASRLPLGEMSGWEFEPDRGWRCPEHVGVSTAVY